MLQFNRTILLVFSVFWVVSFSLLDTVFAINFPTIGPILHMSNFCMGNKADTELNE